MLPARSEGRQLTTAPLARPAELGMPYALGFTKIDSLAKAVACTTNVEEYINHCYGLSYPKEKILSYSAYVNIIFFYENVSFLSGWSIFYKLI